MTAGALDTTFGGTGQVISSQANADSLAVQSDLKTVVAGLVAAPSFPVTNGLNPVVFRYNVNGSLDTSFGSGGMVSLPTDVNNHALYSPSVTIQADGKIVVATVTETYKTIAATKKTPASTTLLSVSIMVLRLKANGNLDETFGTGGEVVISIPNAPFMEAGPVAVLPNGQIIVAGNAADVAYDDSGAGPEFVVARLTPTGALDTRFGPSGQGYNELGVSPGNGNPLDGVQSLGVDASGNILLGGFSTYSTARYFQAVRYTPGGLLDTSFANQGVFDLAGERRQAGIDGIAFQPDGHIILGLAVMPYPNPPKPSVLRLNTNGSIDTTFGSNGYFTETNANPYDTIAVQPDGKVLLSAKQTSSLPYKVIVDRLLPGGTLDPSFGTGGTMAFTSQSSSLGVARGTCGWTRWQDHRGICRRDLRERGAGCDRHVPAHERHHIKRPSPRPALDVAAAGLGTHRPLGHARFGSQRR